MGQDGQVTAVADEASTTAGDEECAAGCESILAHSGADGDERRCR